MSYKVVQSGVVPQGWRLVHDPLANFAGVDIDAAVLESLEEFMPKHEFYSRSPESPWARIFLVRQRNASQSNELRGCIWSKRDKNGLAKVEVASKSEWLDLLNDVFGERLAGYSVLEKDDLWKRVEAAHVEWKATRALS